MAGRFDTLIDEIGRLPEEWHSAGAIGRKVLQRIVHYAGDKVLSRTAETGSGKSTLLFSRMSRHHTVFALDYGGSISAVRSSPLFNSSSVEFVEGATQRTLAAYSFGEKFDLVLIDGPHGYPFPDMEYWYFYPHIAEGGILIIDDIHIPTIHNLFTFVREDAMFELLEVVGSTALFRRTAAILFDPYGDGWWQQGYNKKHFPATLRQKLISLIPMSVQRHLLRFLSLS